MHPIVQRRRARGMTLIEVLIAIVIFAIGLLGIAALQVAGLRYTAGSQSRSVAALQAESMIDRMRGNAIAVADGNYTSPIAAQTVDCGANECTPAELAAYDFNQWLIETRQALGANGVDNTVNAVICIDSTPEDGQNGAWACDNTGNIFAIKLEWLERQVERAGKLADDYSATGISSGVTGFSRNRFVLRFFP
ncbi:MAG: type IV pilus modification protein PilV [Gammaproteobacteria bacterium]